MSERTILTDEFVENELKIHNVPGMGVVISQNDDIILEKGYGYKDLKTKEPIDGDTKWGIASCSKAFTATLAGMLADRGMIEWDRPIIDYLPDFRMYDDAATKKCTIRDMLLHRTGLSEHDALWVDEADRADLFRRLRYLKPRSEFRQEKIYNNTVYTLAGHVAERVAGKSWEEMVKEWIFEPLGMTGSSTTLIDLKKESNIATPYWDYNGDVREIPIWNISPGEPCAGIITCMDDAVKWLKFHLNNGKYGDRQLVSEETMAEMHRGQVSAEIWPEEWKDVPPMHCNYGLGWYDTEYRGYRVVLHIGEIEGYCTVMAFLPDEGITFTAFTNLHKPCVLPLFSVFYTAMDNILNLPSNDWSGAFASKLGNYGGFYGPWNCDLFEGQGEQVKGTEPSHPLSAYTGKYMDEGYGTFEIIEKNGALAGIYRGVEQPMEHYHYDTFKVPNIKEDTLLITAPLTFHADPFTGEINGFEIPLDPMTDAISFHRI